MRSYLLALNETYAFFGLLLWAVAQVQEPAGTSGEAGAPFASSVSHSGRPACLKSQKCPDLLGLTWR
jgi:hypothetical protein